MSGLICFANNKTANYLENCTKDEKSQMIKRAMEEKGDYVAKYRRRKRIEEQKIKQMEERREK